MLPVLQIGPLAIQLPGLLLLLGLWVGLLLGEKYAPRFGMDQKHFYNLAMVSLLGGLLSARLFYALHYLDAFLANPISLLSPNPGLLDLWGGITGMLVVAVILGSRQGLRLLPTLDGFTVTLSILAVFVGLNHLSSGTAYGAPTRLPWAIELWGASRHPSQVYEILVALLICLAIWPSRRRVQSWPSGMLFLVFLSLSSAARLFLEAFRGDSALIAGNFRSPQIIAWLILAVCLGLISRLLRSAAHQEDVQPNPDSAI